MLSMGGHDDDTDDDVDKSLLTVLKYVSSSLSVIGAGSILVSRFLDKEAWQKPARQLLLWLSVADLFTAIIYMVPAQDGPYCTVQSLVGMYFPIASFLLTDCIAYFVYLIVCDQYHGYKRWRLLRSARLPCCHVAMSPCHHVAPPPRSPPALLPSRPVPLSHPHALPPATQPAGRK
mmetsp:Transcript_71933/g.203880  ORF Transcript_71933/g.203880 Transcript_71933/m.203880 type:complete len:176 (-) Transcript_71933:1601-2128(-)